MVLLVLASGCLHVYRYPPREPWAPICPPGQDFSLPAWLTSFLVLGLGLFFMLWLGRRRAQGGGLVLDREGLALVRTARDALRLLVRRYRWPGRS